jgi:hypothetical protein
LLLEISFNFIISICSTIKNMPIFRVVTIINWSKMKPYIYIYIHTHKQLVIKGEIIMFLLTQTRVQLRKILWGVDTIFGLLFFGTLPWVILLCKKTLRCGQALKPSTSLNTWLLLFTGTDTSCSLNVNTHSLQEWLCSRLQNQTL